MKKNFIILISLFIGCAMFAQESSASETKKERIPMYIGASIGFDNWQSVDYRGSDPIRISSFELDLTYGIRPFKKLPNSALEFGIKFDVDGSGTSGSISRTARVFGITAKFIYDFNNFTKLPKLNAFVFGGVNLSSEGYSESALYYDDSSTFFGFTIPVGAGIKYAINNNFEATAKVEFGLGSLMNFGITAGVNYKF